jgi:hypothetical protein
MAFITISLSPGLSKSEHRRGARIGPRSVSSDRTPEDLMEAAGFEEIEGVDVTESFAEIARAWHEQYVYHEDDLRPILGAELGELCKNRSDLISGVEEGLLRRTLVSGRKP